MGLDQYLNAKRYVSQYSDKELSESVNTIARPKTGGMPVKGITCEAMYWRKANAIHDWFVQNVQNGNDDCGEYPVSREQLEDLVEDCKKVLADHSLAAELLPPCAGFFFGSTQLDEWYFANLQDTIDSITKVLEDTSGDDLGFWDFTYYSSW